MCAGKSGLGMIARDECHKKTSSPFTFFFFSLEIGFNMPPKKQIKLAIARPVARKAKEEAYSSSSDSDDAVVTKLDQVDSDIESMDGDDEFSEAEEGSDAGMEGVEEECKQQKGRMCLHFSLADPSFVLAVKPKKGSSDSFAVAMTKILGSNLKGTDKKVKRAFELIGTVFIHQQCLTYWSV